MIIFKDIQMLTFLELVSILKRKDSQPKTLPYNNYDCVNIQVPSLVPDSCIAL